MNREQAKEYLHAHATEHFIKAKKGTFICPICNSGAGKNKTGLQLKDDGVHFTCFATKGCISNEDIIDIIGREYSITGYNEKLQKACEVFGITIDNTEYMPVKNKSNKEVATVEQEKKQEQLKDYTEWYKECNANLSLTNYWQERGISPATCNRLLLGYDKKYNSVVMPVNENTYKTRSTTGKAFYNMPPKTEIVLYNLKALESNKTIYVCESEIDAISIEELGKPAIALRGVKNAEKVKDVVKEHAGAELLLCLDIDEAGTNATETIINDMQAKEIKAMGISCVDMRPLFTGYTKADAEPVKDINDMLVHHRDELARILQLTYKQVQAEIYAKENSAEAYINEFLADIKAKEKTPPIATGYSNLDEVLQGGLREGVYTIGAISSLGKTTFILQMADYIAEHGTDVVYICLEMSKSEMLAKSISRHTYRWCLENQRPINPLAKSETAIADGSKWNSYSEDEKQVIKLAIKNYSAYSKHIYLYENNNGMTIEDVKEIVKHHYDVTGRAPVVVIDYLQILMPADKHMTDKTATDNAMLGLKAISRMYKIPVINIASFNRENYNTQVSFKSFKESGGIEYTSNVVMGLQLRSVNTNGDNIDELKAKNPREIELKILKSRNTKTGDKLQFNYYPQFNYYKEV